MKCHHLEEDQCHCKKNHDDNSADLSPTPLEDDNVSALAETPWHPHNDVSDGYPMDFEEEEEDDVSEDVTSHVRAAPPKVQALIPPVPENGLPALGTIHPMPLE
jgi:hypothetical protein